MHKFSSISAFYQVARYINNVNSGGDVPERFRINGPITFIGSVKLHGSNVGISLTKDEFVCQSRNRVITPDDDNHGFATFAEAHKETIREIEHKLRTEHGIEHSERVIIYGEWIGKGLQHGMAINQLPNKQWVIFAVKVCPIDDPDKAEYRNIVPSLPFSKGFVYSIRDAPSWSVEIDFDSDESKTEAAAMFDIKTAEVEACCPWGKRFGIDGMGEGIVWIPIGEHWGNSDLFFKTKGEKHKNVKSKKSMEPIGPELLNSINEFVEFSVTENRLKQGLDYLEEMGHDASMRSMGHYLKWISQDVQRECAIELETNNLNWKHVQKHVAGKAKEFFMAEMKKI